MDYWVKQTDGPLFPELEWSRPENRALAGKLLIVGGTGYEFKAPANAYGDALEAGVGVAKVLLPSSMQKVVHDIFPEAEFAPSTPSGSFARESLAQLLDMAAWADGVLLPGNLGKNSETSVLLETFLGKYQGQVVLAGDAADIDFTHLTGRQNTLLVLAFDQLRALGTSAKFSQAFTRGGGLVKLVDNLHVFTTENPLNIIVEYEDSLVVATGGHVSSTPTKIALETAAANASVWWLQNPAQTFKALTTSVL